MRKNILFFFICNFAAYILKFPNINTINTYGGNGDDVGTKSVSAEDGGIVIAGYTNSTDGDISGKHRLGDYWVIKINRYGELLWQKCFCDFGHESATNIVRSSTGEFLITGNPVLSDKDNQQKWSDDIWLLRIDGDGNLLSEKIIGDETSDELFRSLMETDAGDFIGTGYKSYKDTNISCNYINEQLYISRFDIDGKVLWEKKFGERFAESGFDIIGLSEKTFIINVLKDSGNSMSSDLDITKTKRQGSFAHFCYQLRHHFSISVGRSPQKFEIGGV